MVDYCELVGFKNDVPYPNRIPENAKFEEIVSDDKERDFIIKLTDKELQNLVVLANFMNIKRLFELCCVRVAYFFRAKEKNIEKIFGVPIAINEDIEVAMKEQYSWAFEIDPERRAKLETEDKMAKEGSAAAPAPH